MDWKITTQLFLVLLAIIIEIYSLDLNCDLRMKNSNATREWKSPAQDLSYPNIHSPVYLIQLAKYEAFVQAAMLDLSKKYSKLFQANLLTKIEHYLYDYTEDMDRSSQTHIINTFTPEDRARIVGENPILSLNMIWRFAMDLPVINALIHQNPYISLVTNGPGKAFIQDLRAKAKWPNTINVEEAMLRFLRLQIVYDLNVDELSTGRIFGVETGPRMSIPLMYSLAQFASENQMYTLAVPWLELVWDELELIEDDQGKVPLEISVSEVIDVLISTMMEHDAMFPRHEQWKDPYSYKDKLLHENLTFVEQRLPMRQFDWTHFRRLNKSFNTVNYHSLCSGENHQTEKEKAELNCWYDRTTDTAFYISPVKKELLAKFPHIVRIHDFISESTIYELKFQANKDELVRSKVKVVGVKSSGSSTPGYATPTFSNIRTSVETFLQDPLPKLSRFIEASTGLSVVSTNSSESYFIASYAFGGHFHCHLDAVSLNIQFATCHSHGLYRENLFADEVSKGSAGNVMSTMMFYLDEPEIGGGTAFIQAGIVVKPIKGSAIYWYNLKRNGEVDQDTHHCGCPVVLGHKTIVTKWIKERNQFRRRPCGLSKHE